MNEEGQIIGKVNGEGIPEGSLVDQEFDVLDAEGNVIGNADAVGEAAEEGESAVGEAAEEGKDAAGEAAEKGENVAEEAGEAADKPELKGPFGVQDNGEITNATGVPIGTLVEGDPKDLVGQPIEEIDEEGNLKAESGSTIGKVDLKAELLEKAEDAAGDVNDKVPV